MVHSRCRNFSTDYFSILKCYYENFYLGKKKKKRQDKSGAHTDQERTQKMVIINPGQGLHIPLDWRILPPPKMRRVAEAQN